MAGYLYRGRHRAPTNTGRRLAVVAVGVTSTSPFGMAAVAPAAHAGPPGGWDPIIECESGGNPNVVNSIGAAGLFQFTPATWRSVGGTGSAADASPAEQYRRAETLYAQRGTQPWNASKSCWSGKGGGEPTTWSAPAQQAPARQAPPRPKAEATGQRAADGTGSYVCGPSTYLFAACDPGDDGQVTQYPPYDGYQAKPRKSWRNAAAVTPAPAPAPSGKLGVRDSDGLGIYRCTAADLGFDACDPDTLGQVVSYPPYRGHSAAPAPRPAPTPAAPRPVPAAAPASGNTVVDAARRYLGVPYQWGGESRAGMDCSGLTLLALRAAGHSPPRTSAAQAAWATPISAAQARPGDLVFNGSPAHHVGVYIGDGRMIDASQPGTVVAEHHVYPGSYYGRVPA